MPSFSFLKSPRGAKTGGTAEVDGLVDDAEQPEKVHRRQSKRDYFRSLLKRSSLPSPSKPDRRRSDHFGKPRTLPSTLPTEEPTSPMNKPLPPPPPGAEVEPLKKPPLQLQRIITPITLPELHKLFSGAPQFFCRSEGHHTGAPHPSVAFPWDLEVRVRDLVDHIRIQDEAWSCVTAWPHLTVPVVKDPEATKEQCRKQRAHFLPRCRERPNMLSMQGLERGTMGYQAALEAGVADALEISEETHIDTISEQRVDFLNRKDGLRPITDTVLVDHLIEVGTLYQEDPLKHKKSSIELYTKLFTQLLFPPSKVIDSDDPYSLEVQIDALVRVLASPTVWVDFSMVEWRIRLGQILWGAAGSHEGEDEISINDEPLQEPGTQRYWLLLQILLACELVVRLDMISMNIDHGVDVPKPAEIRRFEKDATKSVKWSMILARSWLENINLQKIGSEATEKKSAGWLSTLTMGAVGAETKSNDPLENFRFHGRYQAQQLSGLVHFARRIHWPNIEAVEFKAAANGIKISDTVGDSAAVTPMSMTTNQSSSYFPHAKPGLRRALSSHKNISAIIHPGGWLSNSYISGLVLPGEGLSHFLMSTLLENDADALPRLGEQANLYGGFIYYHRSFWSTTCIVGRVLAARAKATECMGWVSSDVVPKGAREGWVDIDVESPPAEKDKAKPRIYYKTAIETEGHVIGGADASSVLPGDFILPSDDFQQPPLSVTFESLDLFASVDSAHSSPTRETSTATPLTVEAEDSTIKTYSAMMRFNVQAEGEDKKEIDLSLSHDIHFITAHPCIFSSGTEVLRAPGNQDVGVATGHPLHKAFTYTLLPLSTILSTPISTRLSTLLSASLISTPSSPSPSPIPTPNGSAIPKVLVIDCTTSDMVGNTKVAGIKRSQFGSDREMIARAICAERGWNALVSRRGRGCLSCAIREFGALGWGKRGVILRIA